MKLETAKTLLECIEQGVEESGDWRVALEQAAEIAKTLVEELTVSTSTPEEEAVRYTWSDWQSEEEELGSDGREGVYWIEISDPNGEEIACIIHRTVDGKFPLDGIIAKEKEARAQKIVDALNGE